MRFIHTDKDGNVKILRLNRKDDRIYVALRHKMNGEISELTFALDSAEASKLSIWLKREALRMFLVEEEREKKEYEEWKEKQRKSKEKKEQKLSVEMEVL